MAITAGQVGDPQVRHRGTIGGSLAHGDPASDLPTVLLALDAEIVTRARRAIGRYRRSTSSPACSRPRSRQDEMLVEIRVQKLQRAGWSYTK